MQGSIGWLPPQGKLGEILAETRKRVATIDRASLPAGGPPAKSLKAALRRDSVAIIAEIKRRSPSKGQLNSALDAAAQAKAFERGGASAISVLTEPTHFGGSIEDLRAAGRASRLPLLRKDFHISAVQLQEASGLAAAVLLIARALPQDELELLMRTTDLEKVVEVRSEEELERALMAGAEIIGVNSRDLETLEVDERVPLRLMPIIPKDVLAVWESGVQSRDDVQRAADCGADAVLVGSALSRSSDPEALVRSLTGVARQPRHG